MPKIRIRTVYNLYLNFFFTNNDKPKYKIYLIEKYNNNDNNVKLFEFEFERLNIII